MRQTGAKGSSSAEAFAEVLDALRCHPYELLIRRWNWKAALFSSLYRGLLFLLLNLTAGTDAAIGAMLA